MGSRPQKQPRRPLDTPPVTTLGPQLRSIRENIGFTLQDMNAICDLQTGYLSQLERGRIQKPSPDVLAKLAETYQVDFTHLMQLAGYNVPPPKPPIKRHTLEGQALDTTELTAREEQELFRYLHLILREKG